MQIIGIIALKRKNLNSVITTAIDLLYVLNKIAFYAHYHDEVPADIHVFVRGFYVYLELMDSFVKSYPNVEEEDGISTELKSKFDGAVKEPLSSRKFVQ